jgi:aromatic-L-amino-acid decarboxylase
VAPLQLSPEEFRKLADRVAAAATEFLATLDRRPIFPPTSGPRTAGVFERPVPEDGMGEAAFDALAAIAEHARAGNRRLFAYVVGSGEPVGALGDCTPRC